MHTELSPIGAAAAAANDADAAARVPCVPTATAAYPRIERLLRKVQPGRVPLCVEKAHLVLESLRRTEGEPQILRHAKAMAHLLEQRTIFIEDDELIVGNPASRPMGMEAGSLGPTWPAEDLAALEQSMFELADTDRERLRGLDDYWKGHGRTLAEQLGRQYDEHLWPFIQSGILLPPWRKRDEGRGWGSAEGAWGLGVGLTLVVVDFEKALTLGLDRISADAEIELARLEREGSADERKRHFLQAVIIVNQALSGIARRYAALAEQMAADCPDARRRSELLRIAASCRHVPGRPPRGWHEALQAFWFLWLMVASGTASGGRFDQFMHRFYRADRDAGRLSDAEAVEWLAALRIKVMQVNFISGGKIQREKWAGFARWNNWVIGGVTRDGRDATNELSYLLLDAAKICPTPHHTLTLRVHDGTPAALMLRAMEVVRLGLGMPAFVGDASNLDYLTGEGATLEDARDYALGGCLDAMIPGRSRTSAIGMFVVPLVLELTLHNGVERRSGCQLGPRTGEFTRFSSYGEFLAAFKRQLAHFMALASEEHDILLRTQTRLFPDALHSELMDDAIAVGRDLLDRELPFENGSVLNPVGMINVADSLAAVKRLVYDERRVSAQTLLDALAADWQGHEALQRLCLAAPKFGNGDAFVDDIAAELYRFWADTAHSFASAWGGRVKCSGISITSYGPGGALTGATPDGRCSGEKLADGTVSAAQGRDQRGPTALVRSGLAIDQTPYQSTLFNLKFHPSALKTEADLHKVCALIKTYFSQGGKHIQFNVVDRATLLDAQRDPDRHRNLIVRIAGYSAYFVQLTRTIQDDIIGRTEISA